MITLYRKPDCSLCDELEDELKQMAITHTVVNISSNKIPKALPRDAALPFIKDDNKIISGKEDLTKYMEDLDKFVYLWRKYQVDACYIDEDGNVC